MCSILLLDVRVVKFPRGPFRGCLRYTFIILSQNVINQPSSSSDEQQPLNAPLVNKSFISRCAVIFNSSLPLICCGHNISVVRQHSEPYSRVDMKQFWWMLSVDAIKNCLRVNGVSTQFSLPVPALFADVSESDVLCVHYIIFISRFAWR